MPRSKRHRSHAREKSRKIMLGMKGGFNFWPFTSNKPTTSPPKSSMFSTITNFGNPTPNSNPQPAPVASPAPAPAPTLAPTLAPASPAPTLAPASPAPTLAPASSAPAPSSITGGRRRRRYRSRRRRSTRSRR